MSYEDTMEFWVKGVFIGLVCIFGLIGNIIAIYILSKSILKPDNKSVTDRLLLGKFQVLFTDLEHILIVYDKVHLFLKQCLQDLQFMKTRYFHQTFPS